MIKLKALTIAGFRGIRTPLTLPLNRNGKPVSAVIFGRNGTGKSSITDAWEYLRTGRVEHLAREGAGEQSYPNRTSGKNETYVTASFDNALLGELTIRFDADRVTKPQRVGAFHQLQEVAPHPCHIRSSDLTQFVYLSKTQRYDLLAQFMGFTAQVEFQKAARRTWRLFADAREKHQHGVRALEKSFADRAKLPYASEDGLCSAATLLLTRHGLDPVASVLALTTQVGRMKEWVAIDPTAKRTLEVSEALKALAAAVPVSRLCAALQRFNQSAVPFGERTAELKSLALLSLYSSATKVLEAVGSMDSCPLCGRGYPGDLSEHIASELTQLEALRAAYEDTARALLDLRRIATEATIGREKLAAAVQGLAESPFGARLRLVEKLVDEWNTLVDMLLAALPDKAERLNASILDISRSAAEGIESLSRRIASAQQEAREQLSVEASRLAGDVTRVKLVEDFQALSAAVDLFPKYTEAARVDAQFARVAKKLEAEIAAFSAKSLADVEARFATISSDVALFFGILEQATPGLSAPSLKVLNDQERAVVLEVVFHGAAIAPAYKYLSESQLNSFGLAVFLASVRRFNSDFGFILLDDVVNSLDAYKRPFLIDILKQQFGDWQVVVLTHDTVWRDRLVKQLPDWHRVHFRRHDFGVGPVQEKPVFGLDEVTEQLDSDRPKTAGQVMGPLIEADLQEFAEALEAPIKYRRYNDHTLEPLLVSVRSRLEAKLGKNHQASIAARSLEDDTGFRNLCAHSKDPDIDVSKTEIERARDKWLDLAALLTCPNRKCGDVVHWDDPVFRCSCGAYVLSKDSSLAPSANPAG
jgi:predicted ATPase